MTQTQPLTKMQVKKLMAQHGIVGELSGAGKNWEVELPDDAAEQAFQEKVTKAGGYRCGWGGWVLRPGYQTDDLDYCNPASRHHY